MAISTNADGVISTGVRSTAPVARATPQSTTPASSGPTTEYGALQQIASGINAKGMSGDQINAAFAAGEAAFPQFFSQAQIDAGEQYSGISGTNPFTAAATSSQISGWVQQELNAIGSVSPALPVVASNPTQLVPLNPPDMTVINPPPAATGSSTTTGSSSGTSGSLPSTSSSTALQDPFASFLSTILPQIYGSNAAGTGITDTGTAGGTTGVGDVSGTDTPISSLGAITPIGTPTTTASTGAPGLLIAVIVIAIGGVGLWWFEHRKKKAAAPPATPARGAAA